MRKLPDKRPHESGAIVRIAQLAVNVLLGVDDSMVSIRGAIEETDLFNSGNKRFTEVLTGGLKAIQWRKILRKRSGWSP
ncbi:MAG: hypothetical protein ACYTDW_18130 [Planctomycetota bacterium]|jgi:hypothetical protein